MLTLLFEAMEESEALALDFEHSLVSLSKWESYFEKPFYSKESQTVEETKKYIDFMLVSPKPTKDLAEIITPAHIEAVQEYINSKQSATFFRESPNESRSNEIITGELMYYWLVAFNIPFYPVETWHLNRLMTLVKICGVKQTKPKKMSRAEQIEEMRKLNEQRRRDLGTSG